MGERKGLVEQEPDYWRQLDIFSPTKFKTPITIIGAGATGSYITMLLAKMGCRDITVYDDDEVETHNLPNQIFRLQDVGKKKVHALAEMVKEATGTSINPIPKKFTGGLLKGIVFALTDTMKSRKQIWDKSVKYQLSVELLIETRMAAEGGKIYAVKPLIPAHVEAYEKTLYSDEESEESACTNRAIAPTVGTIAGIAVSNMLNFVNNKPFPNDTLLSLSPTLTLSKKF